MVGFWNNRRGAIYLFSVVLIAAMLVILVGSLVALEKATSGNILNREEELSYFQLECIKAMENKIASVVSLNPSGDDLQSELDTTISLLREQAEERGMWQNITYKIDFQPSCLDLSPRRVSFDITTKSQGKMAYDMKEFFLNDIFVNGDYLFIENRRMNLRFKVTPGSDETEGYIYGGAMYLGSDVILASSALTDYINMSSWTNATSVYHYTVYEEPGLITIRLRNETSKLLLTKFLYVKLDEVQFQINVEPKVSMEKSICYGIGLTSNINGPENDRFRIDNLTGGPLNPSSSWSNATLHNSTFKVERPNSWIVLYDDDPQPFALALILDEAETVRFSSSVYDDCVMEAPARRGRFVVNGILRSYCSYLDAVTEMRELKKLGKPPLGRTNYLEPLVLALTVKDLSFDPPAPRTSRRVGMFAWVENYGTKDAYDVVVHFYDGQPMPDKSNLLGVTNISTILNGLTEVCSTSWTFTKPGVHEIYVVVDPDQLLPEDPTDNIKHAPLKIYPLDDPNDDISVEAIHISNPAPTAGDTVSVCALVHNNGNRDEEDIVVRLQVIDASNVSRNISSLIIPDIPIDYYVSASISFIYQDGDDRVRMSTDPVVNETNLANNAREAYIGSTGVLIVADDNVGAGDGLKGSTSLGEFAGALDDPTKYHVTIWSEADKGDPTLNVLLFFDAVVWTCGDYDGQDVETHDSLTLAEYIKKGGHLVLEGEDIAYRHHQNATGSPDNFLWNVTKSHISSYYNTTLATDRPLDDVEFDGVNVNPVPQVNTNPTHPVMTNLPRILVSNYTAPYPDGILPINSSELAVYDALSEFILLEDNLTDTRWTWRTSSPYCEPWLVSNPVLSGSNAFLCSGYHRMNIKSSYYNSHVVGDGFDDINYLDLWLYFKQSTAKIRVYVYDGSWRYLYFDGSSVPTGTWLHYRLDLRLDFGVVEGRTIRYLYFRKYSGDVYFDHIGFARKDSGMSSMVAHENATTGSKMVYMAYPVSVVENASRKILIRNAIDWVSGREINRGPTIVVTSPTGGEKWSGTRNITWVASDPDGDVVLVDLCYSDNDGVTWIYLAKGLSNIGYWAWNTSTVPDGNYLVKAIANDGLVKGEDDSMTFEIDNINDPPTVTVTRPNVRMRFSGDEQILWSASDPDGDTLTYDIEWWDGSIWHTLASGYTPPIPANPSYDWNTRTVPDGIDYRIKVRASDGVNTAEDESDELFSIDNNNEDPIIQVIDPNGGEVWSGTHTVTWTMDDIDGTEGGALLGDVYRDRLTATVDYNSSDATFTGSYSPDTNGFFRDWLLLGGFSGKQIDTDYLGGESVVLPWSGAVDNYKTWWKHRDSDTKIDLKSLMNPDYTVTGYAFAYIYNQVDRDVKMKVGSDDGIKVYLNGIMVHRNSVWRGASPDQDTKNVHLNQGWNTVLVKVVQGGGAWAFYFRFTDLSDVPITNLTIALDKPNNYDTGKAYATGARLGSVVDIKNLNWDTKTVPNGNYTMKVTVDDGRGGTAWDTSDSEFEVQNNRDPIVDVIYPNGEEILFGNVTVVWNATDPDGDDMTFDLYYKQGAGGWNLIETITNSTWRWYLWDISGLPDSPPEYYVKVEARDGHGGLGWDVSDDGWYINNADGEFGDGGSGNYTGYGDGEGGPIGGPGTPPGWGGGGGGTGDDDDDDDDDDPADRLSMVMLLSPLGGEEWADTRTISWIHANFGSGLLFDVLVSRDGGSTWDTLTTGITSTTYSWDTKNYPGHGDSSNYRVMVRGYDGESNEDTDSSADFTVYNNDRPSVSVTSPNGGEWWSGIRTITWSANDPDGDGDNDPTTPYSLKFDVYYSDNSGSTWNSLATDITTNSLDWDTTTVTDGDRYRIRVVAKDGNIKGQTRTDNSNSDFHIDNANEAPSVTVNSPNGGEKLKENIPIKWTATDPDADVLTFSIYYSDDTGATWNLIQGGFTGGGTSHTYNWDSTSVPDGTQYMVKVEADDGVFQTADASNSIFIIDNTDPVVDITNPSYPPASVVSKTLTLEGTASDTGGSGLNRVEIWIRGVYEGLATMTGGDGWEFTIDTTTLPEDQTVTVEAIAYDGSGNTVTDTIQMKIDNVGN